MTRATGECCGNCDAFMPDPYNWGEQGACAVIDDDCIARGTYNWTTEDGDCNGWTPRRERGPRGESKRNPKAEREMYEKRMGGDWS